MKKSDLPYILENALKSIGGNGKIVDVCKYVWENYEKELRQSRNLFYTWQYDIRWAATELGKNKKMKTKDISPRGVWEHAEYGS